MQIITASRVDVEEEILNPYSGICCTIIQFDIYRFESLWKFMVQHLIGETLGVCGASVPGYILT